MNYMNEDSTTISERKAVYCKILKNACVRNGVTHASDANIAPSCNSCWVYKSTLNTPHDFGISEMVETTPEFKEMSGIEITGKVRSCGSNYVDIITAEETYFSIRNVWVQAVGQ